MMVTARFLSGRAERRAEVFHTWEEMRAWVDQHTAMGWTVTLTSAEEVSEDSVCGMRTGRR
jgi:hypothetical protein